MCVCVVCVRACVRACVCVFACVRATFCVCVYQRVAPPCTDQKRGPKSRLLLNLIPGHLLQCFPHLYIATLGQKKLVRKEFANSLYLSNTF